MCIICVRITNGKREAVFAIDTETMDVRVISCNWTKICFSRGVMDGGQCPGYCDLISAAKHFARGRKRRNVCAEHLDPEECGVVNDAFPELPEPESLVYGDFVELPLGS